MKVVMVTRLFPPEVAAGAFRLKALADALCAAGHEVTVLTSKPPKFAPSQDFPDYTVLRWPVLRDAGGNVRGYVQYASFDFPSLPRLLFRSADIVISEPPPTTGSIAALVCLLRRKPLYYYAADIWSDAVAAMDAPAFVTKVMRTFEKFALRRARGVIAVSDGVAERARALGARNVEVVANGVDTVQFQPVPQETTDTKEPYFVYTGTMSEWQGCEVFVEAMPLVREKHPTARLRFFGQGAVEKKLRALAAKIAPDAVEFGGVVPPADAARWISGATGALASIVPGKGYDFAKPTKIYAAAACGTPVLFAGVGASAELVEENKLGAVAKYEAKDVAAKMIALLDGDRPDSTHLVNWVRENASLATTGRLAAAFVTEDAQR